MPEGDTIHRLAAAIRPDLVEQELRFAHLREKGRLGAFAECHVKGVEAHGKHLVISTDTGWSLRTHLGMYGDVHRYRSDERWKRHRRDAVLVLETARDLVFAWFEPARAELLPTTMLRAHGQLSRLGPDLLKADAPFDTIVERASVYADARGRTYSIGELLLEQSVACGIGNIYKSETLFLEELHPWTPALAVDGDGLRALYTRASSLLRRNVGAGRRATRRGLGRDGAFLKGESRLWVYGRRGQPCLRCGLRLRKAHQGPEKRVTFYCPRCQPDRGYLVSRIIR